jgi:hypothetical protein
MLDKTIIVFYINVGNSSHQEVEEIIENVRNKTKISEEDSKSCIQYIIPVRDQETKIECINAPIYVSSEEIKEDITGKIELVNRKLDRITSYINARSETRKIITEKQNVKS